MRQLQAVEADTMQVENPYRQRLLVLMRRVPDGVNNGGYQTAVNYKQWFGKATKAINSGTQNEQVLQSLINQYEVFK